MTDNRSPAFAAFVAFVLTPSQFNAAMNKAHLNTYSQTKRSVLNNKKVTNVQ